VSLGILFSARSAEIVVFAAASLTDSLKAISAIHEKQSQDKILFNLGASSNLARQIEEGAPADLFFSADEASMNALEQKGRIIKETRVSRLSNTLVVVVPSDRTLAFRGMNDLTNQSIQRIALADPKSVPAGIYSKAHLQKLGLWSAVEKKVIPTENVRAALAAVASGNVELGLVYKTDAAISTKTKIAFEISRADGPDISYSMAVVKDARQREAATRFLRFLDSPDAAMVFKRFGFLIRN